MNREQAGTAGSLLTMSHTRLPATACHGCPVFNTKTALRLPFWKKLSKLFGQCIFSENKIQTALNTGS